MKEHIEDKLRGWASIIIIFGWIGAVLLFILAFLVLGEREEESFPLFLIIIVVAASIFMLYYFVARLTSAFADITQNTRETTLELRQLNINIQKAFLGNIQATERTIAEDVWKGNGLNREGKKLNVLKPRRNEKLLGGKKHIGKSTLRKRICCLLNEKKQKRRCGLLVNCQPKRNHS